MPRRNAKNIPMSSNELANKLLSPKVNRKIKDNDALQFFLGITPCGASYLLLSAQAVNSDPYVRDIFAGQAWSSQRFISLSPIHFPHAAALSAKLATLANNKARKQRQDYRDRSQANVAFTTGSDIDTLQQSGVDRANFEHNRLLYQLCRGTIDPSHYDAMRVPWFNDIDTMWSFTYNIWASDQRTLAERQQDPKVLDVSWTEYIPPSSSEDLQALSTKHYAISENRMLGNPTRATFTHGETVQAPRDDISSSLQEIFITARRTRPVILFVHDLQRAMLILKFFGVDTSDWRLGIEPVLGRPLVEMRYNDEHRGKSSPHAGRGSEEIRPQPRVRSARSRSPRRGRSSSVRDRSPPVQQKSPYPVYVVDVKSLYTSMRQVPTAEATSVASIAQALRVDFARPEQSEGSSNFPGAPVGWCAGNESRVLGFLWSSMARGNAIDEQRLERFGRIVQQTHIQQPDRKFKQAEDSASTHAAAPVTPAAQGPDDSDSDRDPNDIVVGNTSSRANAVPANDPYASDDDDYIDY